MVAASHQECHRFFVRCGVSHRLEEFSVVRVRLKMSGPRCRLGVAAPAKPIGDIHADHNTTVKGRDLTPASLLPFCCESPARQQWPRPPPNPPHPTEASAPPHSHVTSRHVTTHLLSPHLIARPSFHGDLLVLPRWATPLRVRSASHNPAALIHTLLTLNANTPFPLAALGHVAPAQRSVPAQLRHPQRAQRPRPRSGRAASPAGGPGAHLR
jgi:hypothetical protein